MVTQNTASDDAVRYFLVQHVPDVFRREARNVGVVVAQRGELLAKFYGEKPDGELDGRAIRTFDHPDVYRQWVNYWRRVIKRDQDRAIESLMDPNGGSFNVLDGGYVSGAESDSLSEVCSYAYSMLVSEGGLVEALGMSKDQDEALQNLRDDIGSHFKELGILATSRTLQVPWPVQERVMIRGLERVHPVSFCQATAKQTVLIEPVNFITRQLTAARDHAVFTANAFRDVLAKPDIPVKTYAITRFTKGQKDNEFVSYALGVVEEYAEIVDWSSQSVRRKFLNERESDALAA